MKGSTWKPDTTSLDLVKYELYETIYSVTASRSTTVKSQVPGSAYDFVSSLVFVSIRVTVDYPGQNIFWDSWELWCEKNTVRFAQSRVQVKNCVQWLCVGCWSFMIERGVTRSNSVLLTSWFFAVSIFLAREVISKRLKDFFELTLIMICEGRETSASQTRSEQQQRLGGRCFAIYGTIVRLFFDELMMS